ncbi:MAG TPA: adventurous gliding motility protein CglE [Myxococcota bacterium]|nr:adventurous gliding motility protein CglE [Myxococcota bacterium]
MLLLLSLLSTGPSFAQDYDDLDEADEVEDTRGRRSTKKPDVKEINKGVYAKANVGGAGYIGQFRGFVKGGTAVGLALGQDFVDREKTSMAWELAVLQGIHNGCGYDFQADEGCAGNDRNGDGVPDNPSPFVQGDLRTYSFLLNYEFSKYPTRRIGLGLRLGGGGLYSPLLMDEARYQTEVVQGEWGGVDPGYHDSFKPVGFGGLTLEYYSKLSHFSLGGDGDVFYAVGFDLGFNATAYLKYTF